MIKLVAIDLDGTMYNSKKEITPEVRSAILYAHQNGVETAIITGRGQLGAELAIQHLNIDVPYICSAGAMVRSGLGGEVLGSWPFHIPLQTNKLIQFAIDNDIALLGEQVDAKMIWHGSEQRYDLLDPKTKDEVKQGFVSKDPFISYDRPLLKLTLGTETKLHQAVSFILKECPGLFPVISSHMYLDTTKAGVDKGHGLAHLAKMRGYSSDEVAAIGDQEIDLHAFRFSGLSIAMGNSVQSLKDQAKWIAPSNDEHGVAWALEEIINQNKGEHDR